MVYLELINKQNNNNKFWEIQKQDTAKPYKVIIRYGTIGTVGKTHEIVYYRKQWGIDYIKKQSELKQKKGYIKKNKGKNR